jgi:hypothetical protein
MYRTTTDPPGTEYTVENTITYSSNLGKAP